MNNFFTLEKCVMFLLYVVTKILENKTMRIINCGVFLFFLISESIASDSKEIPVKHYQLKIQLSSLSQIQQLNALVGRFTMF